MSLIRFRGTGNQTIPVSENTPLPVAVISGGGGGGGGPADNVTIVGVRTGVIFHTTLTSVDAGVNLPVTVTNSPSVSVTGTVNTQITGVSSGVNLPVTVTNSPSVSVTGTVNTRITGVSSGVNLPVTVTNSPSVSVTGTVNTQITGVDAGVTLPVTGRVRIETVAQTATFPSDDTTGSFTLSGTNLHDFGGCIIHYQLTNTYTVRIHGAFTGSTESVVAETTGVTGRGYLVLPTFHVPTLRVEFVRTDGTTTGQTNRAFIVLTPHMPA